MCVSMFEKCIVVKHSTKTLITKLNKVWHVPENKYFSESRKKDKNSERTEQKWNDKIVYFWVNIQEIN